MSIGYGGVIDVKRRITDIYCSGKDSVSLDEIEMETLLEALDYLQKLEKENASLNAKLIEALERVAKVRFSPDKTMNAITFIVEYGDLFNGGIEIVLAQLFGEILKKDRASGGLAGAGQ